MGYQPKERISGNPPKQLDMDVRYKLMVMKLHARVSELERTVTFLSELLAHYVQEAELKELEERWGVGDTK